MNRLYQFVIFFLFLCLVASVPAVVDYYIECSRWQSVHRLPESIEGLAESYKEFTIVIRPFSKPEELEKAKKNLKRFQDLGKMVRTMIVELDPQEEFLRTNLLGEGFTYFLNHYTRPNVGTYFHLGFLLSTVAGFFVLFRINTRINKKIADAQVSTEAAMRKEEKAAEEREWKLKQRVANLEGEVQRMTANSAAPMLAPTRPEIKQGSSLQELEVNSTKPASAEIVRPREWKLFLVFNDEEEGRPMPQKQKLFMRTLGPYLKGELAALDPKMLHRKLRWVGKLSPSVRAIKMDKISKGSIFEEWYKMRLGSSFRILIKFDNEQRKMRFFLATHDIYREMYRR